MSITLQTIKSNINQEIPSIYVQINNKKYLFNTPDSFQRFRSEHRITSFQGANIFFNRCEPQYINGIFGFVQTLFSGDTSANQTKIFAPQPSYELFSAIKKSIIVGYCLTPYSIYEFGSKKCISGINKEVQQGIMNKEEQKEQAQQKEKVATDKDMNFANQLINQQDNFQDENLQIVRVLTNQNKACSFICIPKKIPGTVNAQKLQDMKIIGKDRGILLKKGELTLESGETVYAKDFQDPDVATPVFLILDIQNMQELSETMKNDDIQKLFKKNILIEDQIVRLIVHMTQDKQLLQSQQYQDFISEFDNSTIQHLFTSSQLKDEKNQVNVQKTYFDTKPVHLNLFKSLSSELPNLFPKIDIQKSYNQELDQKLDIQELFVNQKDILDKKLGLNYYQYILNPLKSLGYKHILNFKEETLSLKSIEDENMKQKIQQQIQNIKQGDAENVGIERFNPKIIFLGTGSMCPSKLRNVSGILILTDNGNYLFDCGEGTYAQILERFGKSSTDEVLRDLKAIIITHSHSDHHLGCLHLLKQRQVIMDQCQDIQNKEIYLSYPGNMCVWYDIYQKYVDQNFSKYVKLLFNQQITEVDDIIDEKLLIQQYQEQSYDQESIQKIFKETSENANSYIDMQNSLKIRLQTVVVEHCPQAYGIILELYDQEGKNSVKITYSGDTRPCDNFIKYSQDADIMIHEGTFSDDLQKNAESHNHSTTKEAVMSAVKANAKNLILTHFSQRYSKTPKFDTEENDQEQQSEENQIYKKYLTEKTILAFDQLGGFLQQYKEYVDFTWYIAKNLNIDQEEKEEDSSNTTQKPEKKKKDKKQKQ